MVWVGEGGCRSDGVAFVTSTRCFTSIPFDVPPPGVSQHARR
jgi:hypothetical protein